MTCGFLQSHSKNEESNKKTNQHSQLKQKSDCKEKKHWEKSKIKRTLIFDDETKMFYCTMLIVV